MRTAAGSNISDLFGFKTSPHKSNLRSRFLSLSRPPKKRTHVHLKWFISLLLRAARPSPELLHPPRSGRGEGEKFIKYFCRPLPLIAFGWNSQLQLVRYSFPIGARACQSWTPIPTLLPTLQPPSSPLPSPFLSPLSSLPLCHF